MSSAKVGGLPRAVEVVDIATGNVIHRVPTEATGRALDALVRGMLMRVDLDRFFVREPTEDAPA